MCGIAGYVGPKNAVEVVFDQLKRLEYRGYDSAGIAYLNGSGSIKIVKKAGKLTELGKAIGPEVPSAGLAIAHSRWATHGGPTDENAHPHFDQFEDVALIHNGIIENYLELKTELVKDGAVFHSETDTEVAAHVIGMEFRSGVPLEEAVRRGVKKMRGAFAFVVFSKKEPEKFVAARNFSPLIVGIGEGENMVASDVPALLPYTREVIYIEDDCIATITKSGVIITDLDGKVVDAPQHHIEWDLESAEKGGYSHFMIKEIHEQPEVIRGCLAGRIDENNRVRLDQVFSDHVWQGIDRVNIIACGTAYHAGLMGKFLFEKMLRLPTDVFYSSEFRYSDPLLSPNSLAVFISQSGETIDSLAALRLCKQRRIRTLGIVNVVGSAIARECDRTIFTQAGPEISVASTKAYTAQCLVLNLLALYIAQVREMPGVRVDTSVNELKSLAQKAEQALLVESQIKEIATKFKSAKLAFFLGRNADAYAIREAALKFKEITYIPTEECPAGEMKHGPLALVEPGTLAVFGATDSEIREKLASNVREIQARGGFAWVVTTDNDDSLDSIANAITKIPDTQDGYLNALLSAIPYQLFAFHVSNELHPEEIDQPRNLAKSVTVE